MKVSEFSGTKEDWTDFLVHNRGGLLASWEWAQLKESHGWKIRRLQVADGRTIRLVAPVLQKPLPAGYCFFYSPESPIVQGGDWHDRKNQQAFEALHEFLKKDAGPEKALLYKIDPHQAAEEFPMSWLAKLGFRDAIEDVQAPVVVHVDLKGSEEEILAGMKQSGRRHVRQAEKRGVTVTHGHTPKDLAVFYALHETTAKRQNITYRTKEYFEEIRRFIMEEGGKGTFFTGWVDGHAVASILVTFLGEESIYLYGGNDVADHNVYASYLVQWEAMREAKRRGCTFYNMTGISQTEDPNDAWAGLRQFKLKFSSNIVSLVAARDYPYKPVRYQLFQQADRVRRKLAKRSGL